jgi:hypothetical protein
MCFRTYFCQNKPRDVERHNATVSKITGMAWNALSDEERIPYIAQAAAIKAEFMAKHPNWKFKPKPRRVAKKTRRTKKRTDQDERVYMALAMGFNEGKRGKELKRLVEMAQAADADKVSVPRSSVRRNRKSVATKTASTTTKPGVSIETSTNSVDIMTQPVAHHALTSVELSPLTPPIHPDEAPLSQRLLLCKELQSVSVTVLSSARMPHQQLYLGPGEL